MRNIIDEIQLHFESLSKSEKKIANYVFTHKHQTLHSNIIEFAENVNVSTATITRFCKKINCQSFVEFKVLLETSLHTFEEGEDVIDSTEQLYSTIIQSSHSLVTVENIHHVVDQLKKATHIQIYGIGSSGLSGEEFRLRLHRMGITADTSLDSHTMLMSAALSNKDTVVFAISNSGRTKEVLESVELAKEQKATIITLTNRDSTPLSEVSDFSLFTASYLTYENSNFINSQLSIMFVIDILSRVLLEDKGIHSNYQKTLQALDRHKKI